MFGFVTALLTPQLCSPIIADAIRRPNLVAYRDRILQQHFAAGPA